MQRLRCRRYKVVTRTGHIWARHLEWGPDALRVWARRDSGGASVLIAVPRETVRYVEAETGRETRRARMRRQWQPANGSQAGKRQACDRGESAANEAGCNCHAVLNPGSVTGAKRASSSRMRRAGAGKPGER